MDDKSVEPSLLTHSQNGRRKTLNNAARKPMLLRCGRDGSGCRQGIAQLRPALVSISIRIGGSS